MTAQHRPLVGGIEAGGTKFVCAVGHPPDDIRAETRFPTTTPVETLERAIAFFHEAQAEHGRLAGIGIASFGPVDRGPGSPGWGRITSTPKPGWWDTDVAGPLATALGCPVAFETDVTGAAIAEGLYGAAHVLRDFVYVTVGTGIGGGVIAGGRPVNGLIHPELGHIRPARRREDDDFAGICPYHGDCLEGLASGPAIEARWGRPAAELAPEHPAWETEADYLAQMCATLTFLLSPERIILGGGVMAQSHLFERIRERTAKLIGGYLDHARLRGGMGDYIVPPALGGRAGVVGALAMAEAVVTGEARHPGEGQDP